MKQLVVKPIETVGSTALRFVELAGGVSLLFARSMIASTRLVARGRARQMAWDNVFAQMVRVGVRSIPIVCLVVFCIGVILALQMAPILSQYGAQDQVATIISVAMFRELGPLVGAIVLTGFAGASIAAEMGTMVVGEEIEALETHAIDPVRFLVMPRVLATAVMTFCLAILANLVGVLGGLVACWLTGVVDPVHYWDLTFQAPKLSDYYSGLMKAFIFGGVIALLACYLGLSVTGGAEGVGNATTSTVVQTIVALTFIDLLFTAVFYTLGI
jgi:phospholipid/cholesterol/gamma-HCH transport system permease protein